MSIVVKSHPSLALIKYWGKESVGDNTAATSSLALNLEAFVTKSHIALSAEESVSIDGEPAPLRRFHPFFTRLRSSLNFEKKFQVDSTSNFPVAAGLASSSSGFAALALGCGRLANPGLSLEEISAFARLGSASAARSVFAGFSVLERGEKAAKPLFPQNHWPHLRIIISIVTTGQKSLSSREAMVRCQETSPFYTSWLDSSQMLFTDACEACAQRDLQALGPLMRQSYLQMFATMFSAFPPILYWEPESLSLIKTCEELRSQGLTVWETMDAGPQVKLLCEEEELKDILTRLKKTHPKVSFLVSKVGGGAEVIR